MFICNGNQSGFFVNESVMFVALLIVLLLFEPGTKIKLFIELIIADVSIGNLIVWHSSNSMTPFNVSEIDWSINKVSISSNSKNESLILSFSDILAEPETSISLLPSKHRPSILCTIKETL